MAHMPSSHVFQLLSYSVIQLFNYSIIIYGF